MNDFQAPSRRFHKRIIIVVPLWLVSAIYLWGTIVYFGLVLWNNVNLRWYHPDPPDLEFINEDILSPPVVAAMSLLPFGACAAALAARSFWKGMWRTAIRRSIVLVALTLLFLYLKPSP